MSNDWNQPRALPDLAFVDVETTGLDPGRHRVIEIAVTRVKANPSTWDAPIGHLCYRFTPSSTDLAQAEPGALKVNGYHQGHPDWSAAPAMDSQESDAAWEHVAQLTRRAVLVSQNVAFDRGFMQAEISGRDHWNMPWDRRVVDIQSFSWLVALHKGLSTFSLHAVYDALGLGPLPEHRAEADVKRGMAVMRYVHEHFGAGVARRAPAAILSDPED